ncbi:MAG: sigma-70 family RNA polymerase sigma factor [bacterium]|nr:sigma-70 family RNA polymerase sigma factor [bacterium]
MSNTDLKDGNGQSPDEGRVEQLLGQHLPGLRGFLRRRAPEYVLDKESSEDLAQSVCRDVLEHLEDGRFEVRGDAEFKQWLYDAALWKLRARSKHLRALKREVAREVADVGGEATDLFEPRTSMTPSRIVSTEEQRTAVRNAIAKQEGRDAEILTLAVLEERSHREIATQLGISESHSRVLLSRALVKMARELEDG